HLAIVVEVYVHEPLNGGWGENVHCGRGITAQEVAVAGVDGADRVRPGRQGRVPERERRGPRDQVGGPEGGGAVVEGHSPGRVAAPGRDGRDGGGDRQAVHDEQRGGRGDGHRGRGRRPVDGLGQCGGRAG